MVKLTQKQINDKIDFINQYKNASNAASGSKMDANANVSCKNIATLEAELNKDINIQINRSLVKSKISELFGADLGNEYIRQLESHEIYAHDETSLKPYCVSISMYPFLLDGLTKLGGESKAPKHIESFCGSFVNLIFAISSQFAGAVAAVEFLMYLDYFARKDYGDNYISTHSSQMENHLQHVVYAINQPAAARGYQSVFFNISIYDQFYFNSLFGDFVFPDMSKPSWESTKNLQAFFMKWFNKERTLNVLTFPVVTAAMLVDDNKPLDSEFSYMCAKELSEGNSFFVYQSTTPDSLASCCRLRNEMSTNTFSHSSGAGGVATGSINVITLNVNRMTQLNHNIHDQIEKIQKYQVAYRKIIEEYMEAKMLPVYDAGFISLDKQYLTIGLNGIVEAAEFHNIKPANTDQYKTFVTNILKDIYVSNKAAKAKYGYMFNTEFVPAENLGVKNAQWDRADGLGSIRDCYNSYFYPVESSDIDPIDKFTLHGKDIIQYLDGGSALHLNLDEYPTTESFSKLLSLAAKTGCNYFCFNIRVTICNDCNYINKQTRYFCTQCKSSHIDHAVRIIGYLKRVSNFSEQRQVEHKRREYHNPPSTAIDLT